jgi:hypothetical protein
VGDKQRAREVFERLKQMFPDDPTGRIYSFDLNKGYLLEEPE